MDRFTANKAAVEHPLRSPSRERVRWPHLIRFWACKKRAFLVLENTSRQWLGNASTYTDSMAAHLIWEALGVPDGWVSLRRGDHAHCISSASKARILLVRSSLVDRLDRAPPAMNNEGEEPCERSSHAW